MVRSREMACGISFEATATSTVLFLLVSNVNLNEHVLLLNHFYTLYRFCNTPPNLPLPLTFFYISRFLDGVSFACLHFSSPCSRRRNVTARNEEFITPFEKFIFSFLFFFLLRRMLNLKGARYWPVNHPNSRCFCFEVLRSIGRERGEP